MTRHTTDSYYENSLELGDLVFVFADNTQSLGIIAEIQGSYVRVLEPGCRLLWYSTAEVCRMHMIEFPCEFLGDQIESNTASEVTIENLK